MRRNISKTLMLVVVLCLAFSSLVINVEQKSVSPIISKTISWGASGSDVREVQTRLKNWGYYQGAVDGVYGSGTYNAVIKFQKKNGLSADGVVGPETLKKLGLYTATVPSAQKVSTSVTRNDDLNLLARVIHAEAGAEPYEGKVAVGAVILNRIESSLFPNTLAGVIYQPLAFESVSNGIVNRAPSSESVKAAQACLNGWDPSYGCLFFWNPSKPVNKWIWSRQIIRQIGQHVFAK